jgi:hypothetical protein
MFYSGESNVPGAPGNLMAGSPGYFFPETEIQRRMQERYYQTPEGQKLIDRTNKLKEKIKQGNFFPTASLGNTGAMLAQSYPVYGQPIIPDGFEGKYLS